MNKKLKDLIIGLVIGFIVSGTVAFALTTYPTDEVIYIRNGEEEDLTISMNEVYNHMYSGDATATDLRKDKTGLVNGQLVTGTSEINQIATLKKTTFSKSFDSQYGTNVTISNYQANRITYSINISSNISNCTSLTKSNIAVEMRSFNTTPTDFGGVAMDPNWSYNPSNCTLTVVSNGRKGFNASRSATFYISVFTIEEKTV